MTALRASHFLCLLLAGLLSAGAEEKAELEAEPESPGYLLRPAWEPGKRYRWLQRLKAVATVAGLGKQSMEWRQHFHMSARAGKEGEELELEIESIRVDIDVGGERSRYYFDPEIPLRFQERTGVQGSLLRHTELFVRNRYVLRPASEQGGRRRLELEPLPGRDGNASAGRADWEVFPWETLSAALLHQGIPAGPVAVGAAWQHEEELLVAGHGKAVWELESRFTGFKDYEGRQLALIEFGGTIQGAFHREAGVKESPGIAVELPDVRGLTLIDLKNRSIASTVVKLEGKLRSLGLPGTVENETAPVKKTLTLTLLGTDER